MVCLVAQSCPTLCNPMDYSLPGSSVHGDSPGKNPGVGCYAASRNIFFFNSHSSHLELGAGKGEHCQMAEKKSGAQRGEWSIPSITQLESRPFLSQPVSRAPLPHSLSPLLSAFMSLERDLKRQALEDFKDFRLYYSSCFWKIWLICVPSAKYEDH